MSKPPQLQFLGSRILIARYPFKPWSCRRDLDVSSAEITEVDTKQCRVRVGDEFIYLPGWPSEALAKFCSENGLILRERYDVWADLLEPFVDSSFSREEVAERKNRLKLAGLSFGQVLWLRLLYLLPIAMFQGIAGEWVALHHYHLLGSLWYLRLLGLYGFAYRHTMRIALSA